MEPRRRTPRVWPDRSHLLFALVPGFTVAAIHAAVLLEAVLGLRGRVPTRIDVAQLWVTYGGIVTTELVACWLVALGALVHLDGVGRRWIAGLLAALATAVVAAWTNPLVMALGATYVLARPSTRRTTRSTAVVPPQRETSVAGRQYAAATTYHAR